MYNIVKARIKLLNALKGFKLPKSKSDIMESENYFT